VPGDHEYETPRAAGYFDYFNGPGALDGPAGARGKGYYSFDIENWHVVALNSNCPEVGGCGEGSPQNNWLEADLAANPSSCLLAYWHAPRFSSGPHGSTPSVAPFWDDLYPAGADVVLNGDDHLYERFARQDPNAQPDPSSGIRQFTVGTGGKSLYAPGAAVANSAVRNGGSFGVLELSLRPDGYGWRFVPESRGTFTDGGSDLCAGSVDDTEAPTVPEGLTKTSVARHEVGLAWNPSTDNEGVAGYNVLRDGVFLGSATTASYADDEVEPGRTYEYRVAAYDSAGNTSEPSSAIRVTTPDEQLSFAPSDDASVESAWPSTNFGAAPTLEVDASPVQEFLLRFEVSGLAGRTVQGATLRLRNTNSATSGGRVHATSQDSWIEETLTWANAPAADGAIVASIGSVSAGNDYEIPLDPSAVTSDGVYSFRVVANSTDGATYSSKEAGSATVPRLVLDVG
jgi:hypothetical protein